MFDQEIVCCLYGLQKASSYWLSSVFVVGTTIEVDFVLVAIGLSTVQCKTSVHGRAYPPFLHPHNITDYLAVQIREHAL